MFGCTKMAVDTFRFTKDKQIREEVLSHSLGQTPKYAFVNPESVDISKSCLYFAIMTRLFDNNYNLIGPIIIWMYNGKYRADTSGVAVNFSESDITIYNNGIYLKGVEYTLITMA